MLIWRSELTKTDLSFSSKKRSPIISSRDNVYHILRICGGMGCLWSCLIEATKAHVQLIYTSWNMDVSFGSKVEISVPTCTTKTCYNLKNYFINNRKSKVDKERRTWLRYLRIKGYCIFSFLFYTKLQVWGILLVTMFIL